MAVEIKTVNDFMFLCRFIKVINHDDESRLNKIVNEYWTKLSSHNGFGIVTLYL